MLNTFDPKTTPWEISEADYPSKENAESKIEFILRYAILAPSSHNTQPWKFSIGDHKVDIHVDTSRWLSVADSDKRELYISIGCVLENLLIAADRFGFACEVDYMPDPEIEEYAARVSLSEEPERDNRGSTELLQTIPDRQTNHNKYDETEISEEILNELRDCIDRREIHLHLTDDPEIKQKVDKLIVRGDAMHFSNPEWREELGHWMGKGVFGTSWFTSKVSQLAVTYLNVGKSTAKKDSELLNSAPVLGVISSDDNDRESQIRAGQAFERVSLKATSRGLSLHPMSQILEIPELKSEVGKLIPLAHVFPQQTFRLGYAKPEGDHTPRRPLKEVLF